MNHVKPPSSHLNPDKHLVTLLTHPWYVVINRLYSEILHLTHEFYANEGIEPVLFPITTGSVSSPMGLGSDSLPVQFNLNDLEVYLADSMQFSLEIGARLNKKGAYYIMPTFRGEDIDARHLNEFAHSEAEIRGKLEDAMQLAERYVKFMTRGLLKNCSKEITSVTGTLDHLELAVNKDFSRVRFEDALAELKILGKGYEQLTTGDCGITPEGELLLMKEYGECMWLTHLPWKIVPFYQSQEVANPNYSNTADLLAGIGEMLGLGQRAYDGKALDQSLDDHEVNVHGYEWYRQMHNEFPIQTSGFGLGIERFILWVLRHDDIRDCTILLRDHKKILFP